MADQQRTVYTIGHSTHTIEHFLELLKEYEIELLADVRHIPGSKRFPHFNKEALEFSLKEEGIQYMHFKELGGRRKADPESKNTAWRLPAFRSYADHMETEEFKRSIERLQQVGSEKRLCYMCSEAVWWSCHRSLISDHLKSIGWRVMHIMSINKLQEHPYTSAALIVDGKLSYQGLV